MFSFAPGLQRGFVAAFVVFNPALSEEDEGPFSETSVRTPNFSSYFNNSFEVPRGPTFYKHFALSPRLHSQAMRPFPFFPPRKFSQKGSDFRALKSRAGSSPASSFKAEVHFLSLVQNFERETELRPTVDPTIVGEAICPPLI